MLALVFSIGAERYALDGRQVAEVLPRAVLRPLPKAPDYAVGLFNFRGEAVPVIDLCRLAQDRPCQPHLSTRVVLVRYVSNDGRERLLGLLAERVTGTEQLEESRFVHTGVRVEQAPYLGKISMDVEGQMIQAIRVEDLLSEEVEKLLFARAEEGEV